MKKWLGLSLKIVLLIVKSPNHLSAIWRIIQSDYLYFDTFSIFNKDILFRKPGTTVNCK